MYTLIDFSLTSINEILITRCRCTRYQARYWYRYQVGFEKSKGKAIFPMLLLATAS